MLRLTVEEIQHVCALLESEIINQEEKAGWYQPHTSYHKRHKAESEVNRKLLDKYQQEAIRLEQEHIRRLVD